MRAQVVLREIAGPGLDLAQLAPLPHRQGQPRADRAAVALSSPDSRCTQRSRCRVPPASFSSRFAAAPLLVISRSRSPSLSMSPAARRAAHQLGREPRTGGVRHVDESFAGVAQQQVPLRVSWRRHGAEPRWPSRGRWRSRCRGACRCRSPRTPTPKPTYGRVAGPTPLRIVTSENRPPPRFTNRLCISVS